MKPSWEKIGQIVRWIIYALFFTFLGLMFGVTALTVQMEKYYRESPTIDEQHQSIMLDHEWLYCPYCGERIREE